MAVKKWERNEKQIIIVFEDDKTYFVHENSDKYGLSKNIVKRIGILLFIKYLKISYTLLAFEISDWIQFLKYLSGVIGEDLYLKTYLIRINDLKNIYSSYQYNFISKSIESSL